MPVPSILVRKRLWWSPPADDPWLMIFFLIGMCHFLGIGIVEFHHLGGERNIQTFADALLCFVLLTTVGYGNTIAPSTPTSRLATVAYSAYGPHLRRRDFHHLRGYCVTCGASSPS